MEIGSLIPEREITLMVKKIDYKKFTKQFYKKEHIKNDESLYL